MYGDSGTGKSSSIKALLNRYYKDGLRMVEVYKHQFISLPQIINELQNRHYRFIIFMDDLSFERIINVPSRGIGQKTIEKIQLKAIEYGISCYEAVCLYSDEIGLKGKAKKAVSTFVQAIEKARQSREPLGDVFEHLLRDVGYFQMLRNDDDENRIQNIMELKIPLLDI